MTQALQIPGGTCQPVVLGGPPTTTTGQPKQPQLIIDRFSIFDTIGSGGMGAVHLGQIVGAAGFTRLVAVKRMHRDLCEQPEYVTMFRDELRMATYLTHPNVVQTFDV